MPLRPLFRGPDPVTLTPSPTGFQALVPIVEPLTAGAPPVTPTLVRAVSPNYDTRGGRTRSGHRLTRPGVTLPRPTCVVRWGALTLAQRNTLLDWIHTTLLPGVQAMTVEVDGPGAATGPGGSSSAVKLRALAPPTDTHVGKGCWTVELSCEEVW